MEVAEGGEGEGEGEDKDDDDDKDDEEEDIASEGAIKEARCICSYDSC